MPACWCLEERRARRSWRRATTSVRSFKRSTTKTVSSRRSAEDRCSSRVRVSRRVAISRDFHLANEYPELVIRPIVEKYGGIWREDAPVVVEGNLVSSRHPNDMAHFSSAIRDWLVRR